MIIVTYGNSIFCGIQPFDVTCQKYDYVNQDELQPGDEMKIFDSWYKIPNNVLSVLQSTKSSCIYSRIYFRRPKET